MTETLLVLAGAFGAFYLLAPLGVRASFLHRADPALETVGPQELPAHVAAALDPDSKALERRGFRPVGCYRLEALRDTPSWHALLRDDDRRTLALVSFTEARTDTVGPSITNHCVELMTLFRDDHRVETSNTSEPVPGVGNPRRHKRTQLPGVRKIDLLCDVHAMLVARMHPMEPKPLAEPGQEAQILLDDIADHAAGYTRERYFVRDAQTGDYKLTLKGACLLSRSVLPPLKQIRMRRLAAHETRLLGSLRLERWQRDRRAA